MFDRPGEGFSQILIWLAQFFYLELGIWTIEKILLPVNEHLA